MSHRSSHLGHLKAWFQARALQSPDVAARLHAVEKLATSTDVKAVQSLIETLSDEDEHVRACAAMGLGDVGDEDAIEPLVQLIQNESNHEILVAATSGLAKLDRKRAIETLMAALDHEESAVRQNAASAARKVLWAHLSEQEQARVAVAQSAWAEVASLGTPAIEALVHAVHHGTQHGQREAAEALGSIANPEACAALERLLEDDALESTSREIAAWALKNFYWQDLDETQCVRIGVVDGDWLGVVEFAAVALVPLGEALVGLNHEARQKAAEAIATIGGPEAAELLGRTLADRNQDVAVRQIAAKALGQITDGVDPSVLASALRDAAWDVRRAAATSLRALKWLPTDDAGMAWFRVADQHWDHVIDLGEAAIEPLVDALQFRQVSTAAASALTQVGPAGLEALLDVLRAPGVAMGVREVVATTLAEIGDPRAIEPVEAMLEEHDMVIRQAAVWTLQKLGWEPSNDEQKALAAIANEDWDELGPLGSAAVEPLLRMATDSLAPEQTINALREVMELSASRLTVEELRAIAALGDIEARHQLDTAKYTGDSGAVSVGLDCKKIRDMALAELVRRGLLV